MIVRLSLLLLLSSLPITFTHGHVNDTIKSACPFTILKVDNFNANNIKPGDYIIKTYSELVDYWELAFGPLPISPLPNVYFSSKMVIAINEIFGEGGHGIIIDSIYETRDKVIISIKLTKPKGYRTFAIDNKCVIFEMKKTNKPIEIMRTELILE